jgi:hypothetical protein
MILTSRGLALEGSVYGELAVAAIAEIYAAALIGGAALLMRIGQRRPAVMLGLLTVLYQCDLTLHTEACVNLGPAGLCGTAAWTGLFVAKLYALAWALRLRISRAAAATATLGAFGLATFPYLLQSLDPRPAGAIVSVWFFALASMHARAEVTSAVPLDAWGSRVLRRAVLATWTVWTTMLGLHVLFWSTLRPLGLGVLVALPPLLFVRRLQREAHVWSIALFTLAAVGWTLPSAFATTALLAAGTLLLRAREAADADAETEPVANATGPYRGLAEAHLPAPTALDGRARLRLAFGALFALYLSFWTHGWSGGPWPAHSLPLDASLLAIAIAVPMALRARAWFPLPFGPLALTGAHLVVQLRLVPEPRSLVGWGVTALTLGFLSLLVALGASYGFRHRFR